MKWLIAILILATILIAGCTQVSSPISSVACKPNWVLGYQNTESYAVTDDLCKSQCYAADKVTAHKIENVTQTIQPSTGNPINITLTTCYCDINNCNP